MKFSQKERKYRSKIIAENHLKKDGQKYLDRYVERKLLKYKIIYINHEELHTMLAGYGLHKISAAMKDIGISLKDIGTSFVETTNTFQRFSASAARLETTISNYNKII